MSKMNAVLFAVAFIVLVNLWIVEANTIGVCIRNCAQCKKMFGPYFEGQLCADACIKFKGKMIPDCEDLTSIAPFLSKFSQY
ncbi:eclosion hormone-like [Rhynchophorus ferrugineus]|uniref:eclosion hormone-like n=1 Tax=Rhynchophorus ferrugineus TaxID=354439 RepID=UPI003FCC870B